jgi:hypothetical protein
MNDFLKLMKKTAVEAVNASKPANMVFGKVISISPLKIKVDQKLILTSAQLVLSRNVTEYKVFATVDHTTEDHTHSHSINDTYSGGGSASSETHRHEYKGKKEFLIHNALTVGEEVILMQVSGGQKYIVIDRIGKG